jgi:hypothetical protein
METKPKNKGGRPLGAANRLAIEAREKAQASGELPHEFLLRISRGEPIFKQWVNPATGKIEQIQEEYDFDARKDAAKAAAPYFAPKISTVEVIRGVADDELDSIIAKLAAETGFSTSDGGESTEGESSPSPTSRRRAKLVDD